MSKNLATSVLPGERSVVGPFGDVGYIAKRPGYGAAVEKMLEERAQNRVFISRTVEKRKDLMKDRYLNAFYRKFDELSLRAAVKRLTELGLEEDDRYLAVRQNKLRQLLLEDQSKCVEEYTTKAQNATDDMLEKEKLQAEEIVRKSTEKDYLRAQQVYLEITLKKSDEYKEKVRRANIKSMSESYEEQIRLQEDLKRMEREENEAWDARREKEYKEAKIEELQRKAKIAEEKRLLSESLRWQVEEQEHIKRRQTCIDEVEEERNKEIQKVWEDVLQERNEEVEKRQKLNHAALLKQIEMNRLLAKQYQNDELLVEKIMVEDKAKKAARVAAAEKTSKIEAWNELVVFRESVVQYRKAAAMREKEAEKIEESVRKTIDTNTWNAKRAAIKERTERKINHFEELKLMTQDKKTRENESKALTEEYGRLAMAAGTINDRLDEELRRRKAVDWISLNKAQMKYQKMLENREKMEDEEMLRKLRSLNEENSARVKAALKRPVAEITGTSIHPFQKVLGTRK